MSRLELGSMNVEFRQGHGMQHCIGDSKFLTLYKQGTVVFLVRRRSFETDSPDANPIIPLEWIHSGEGEKTNEPEPPDTNSQRPSEREKRSCLRSMTDIV
jgi:hypothetical protein